MSNSHYTCDRCEKQTPNGDGIYHDGQRLCCDCAEIVAFWETVEA